MENAPGPRTGDRQAPPFVPGGVKKTARALSGSATAPSSQRGTAPKCPSLSPIRRAVTRATINGGAWGHGGPILVPGAAFSWRGNAAASPVSDRLVHRDRCGNPRTAGPPGGSASDRDRTLGGAGRRVRDRSHEHHQSSSSGAHGFGVWGGR